MTAHERHTITRAICRQADGSRTDGKKWLQLPLPVMRFDVNLPATDHPEVASDADSFTGLFLTNYCKALSRACFGIDNFHNNETFDIESKERLVIEYSIRLDKNRTFTHNEINVLLYSKHESLPSLDSNYLYCYKVKQLLTKNKSGFIFGNSERHTITRAICRQADGSRTNLFLTNYCKALSRAFNCKCEFHKNEFLKSESKERLVIEYSIRLDKNRTSTQKEINVLLYKKHESLPLSTYNRLTTANL